MFTSSFQQVKGASYTNDPNFGRVCTGGDDGARMIFQTTTPTSRRRNWGAMSVVAACGAPFGPLASRGLWPGTPSSAAWRALDGGCFNRRSGAHCSRRSATKAKPENYYLSIFRGCINPHSVQQQSRKYVMYRLGFLATRDSILRPLKRAVRLVRVPPAARRQRFTPF